MDSRYDHLAYEQKIYDQWEAAQAFNPDVVRVSRPDNSPTQQPFCIIMPPPNANDPLHIGHAVFVALEDLMIRFHRMRGDDTLWLPGTDHAGIETQFVFEKKLKKEDKSRFDFDRQTLYQMIWDYVQENSGIAVDQMKRLGASADWSRFTFTLDPGVVKTVKHTFEDLYAKELVYRDEQLVNYCTHCGTSYSDLEVNHVERQTPLYYIKYVKADDPHDAIEIATVRPELIDIDTHLAVHPDNKKTQHLIGQKVLNPLTQAPMEIIADDFVDPEFGTGIVKLTPAHDPFDYEAAKKHHLPVKTAIGFNGKMTGESMFEGLSVAKARERALELLAAAITKTDTKYVNRVGTCYRCGRVLEKLLRLQFFIKVKPLTKPVLEALDSGEVTVYGAGHDKILKNWLLNLHDWNISRQIVWGIRIPIWYQVTGHEEKFLVSFLDKEGKFTQGSLPEHLKNYSLEDLKASLQQVYAHDKHIPFVISEDDPSTPDTQYLPETDTFDTWFSSGQWPFATLKNTQPGDFERFYPTQVMETAYDILPFWVMRMLMLGYFETNQKPFKNVYFHGLIRDAQGKKMSKSKGNVINPLSIIEKYGADALRLALVIRSSPGLDKSVGEGDFKAMRNFTNKIWNATRFIANWENKEATSKTAEGDAVFLAKLSQATTEITSQLQEYKLGLAADTLYSYFWHWFCDEAIEDTKQGKISFSVLKKGLETFLKLLHPFAPFVTEAAWSGLGHSESELLITQAWPTPQN